MVNINVNFSSLPLTLNIFLDSNIDKANLCLFVFFLFSDIINNTIENRPVAQQGGH